MWLIYMEVQVFQPLLLQIHYFKKGICNTKMKNHFQSYTDESINHPGLLRVIPGLKWKVPHPGKPRSSLKTWA